MDAPPSASARRSPRQPDRRQVFSGAPDRARLRSAAMRGAREVHAISVSSPDEALKLLAYRQPSQVVLSANLSALHRPSMEDLFDDGLCLTIALNRLLLGAPLHVRAAYWKESTEVILGALSRLEKLAVLDISLAPLLVKSIAAACPNLVTLALTGCAIGDDGATAVVAGLPHLTSLDLSGCHVGDTGANSIGQGLRALKTLDLSGNDLSLDSVRTIVGGLPELESLALSGPGVGDEGATLIARGLGRLALLRLGDSGVGDAGASAIANGLVHLTSLDLSGGRVGSYGAESIANRLRNLTSLDLSGGDVESSGAIAIAGNLPGLVSLSLSGSDIGASGIQAIATGLAGLTRLEIARTRVDPLTITSIVDAHPRLTTLTLSGSGIDDPGATALAKGLPELLHLSLLRCNVGADGLKAIVDCLPRLRSLALSEATVGDAGASVIASALSDLTALTLSRCGVGAVGARAIAKKLPDLTSLDLSRGPGVAGAKLIADGLPNLTHLVLSGCGVGDSGAPAIAAGLPNLVSLDLSDNNVLGSGFTETLNVLADASSSRLTLLDLTGNAGAWSLSLPELTQSVDARATLAAYRRFRDTAPNAKVPFGEAKLVLLGDEWVGKTSLVNALVMNKPCDPSEPKTPGVSHQIWVTSWSVGEVGDSQTRLNVWDFGGQEILHQTHRYFLTERCLHLIVLDRRKEDDKSVYFWLRTIRTRAPNSPVIVVINKCDDGTDNMDIDLVKLRSEYPEIVDLIRVSCAKDPDLPEGVPGPHQSLVPLRDRISELLTQDARLESVHLGVAAAWVRVRNEIRAMAEQEQVLGADRYLNICLKSVQPDLRVTSSDEQRGLLRMLSEMGVVVAHGLTRQTTTLVGLTLLDPNWLTDAIYALLADGSVRDRDAVFDRQLLGQLLRSNPERAGRYPDDRLDYIVDMMQEPDFGLCFRLPGESDPPKYLLPEALTPNAPAVTRGWDPRSLWLRYSYVDLPRGLIPRFLVAAHNDFGEDPARWRSGCTLEIDGCPVLIDGDLGKSRVDIRVAGPVTRRKDALAVVRSRFREVHERLPETRPSERVPLPHDPEIDVGYEHLRRMEDDYGSDYRHRPDGSDREYRVGDLLSGVRETDAFGEVQVGLVERQSRTSVIGRAPGAAVAASSGGSRTDVPVAGPTGDSEISRLANLVAVGGVVGALLGVFAAATFLLGRGEGWPLEPFGALAGIGTVVGSVLALLFGVVRPSSSR